MRRLMHVALALACLASAACANRAVQPPGGPEDKEAPRIVRVTPDSGAANQRPRVVNFVFDETISDRPSRGELNQYFLVSPSDGDPRVDWHRRRISVRPRRGFRANTAYTITVLPGLADLRGNAMKDGAAIVFSTGATFPRFGIAGRVFDWAAERPAPGAFIQAISRPDSVVYLATSDSLGAFSIGPFGAGRYTLVGIIDRNNNRALDPGEAWDSTSVVITVSRPIHDLLAIPRDTIPPRISAAAAEDSATIRVTFDRPINPAQTLQPSQFRVQRTDSTELAVSQVLGARAEAAERAARDSAAPPDSTRVRAPSPPGAPPSVVPIPGARPPAARPPAVAAPPAPKPPRPAPDVSVVLRLTPPARLEPGTTYRVSARDVENLLGKRGTSARTLAVPRQSAPARRDTASAAPPPRRPPSSPPQ